MPTLSAIVPSDIFHFGQGPSFDPQGVNDFFQFEKSEVSRITEVSEDSVRFDDAAPLQLRARFEEIANLVNAVAETFDGNTEKTRVWFNTCNPTLGDISPRDMIRLGRYERLHKFIAQATLVPRSTL